MKQERTKLLCAGIGQIRVLIPAEYILSCSALVKSLYSVSLPRKMKRQRERERKSEGKRGRQTDRLTEIHTGRTGVQEQNNCNQQVKYKGQEICRTEGFTYSNLPRTQCKQAFSE